jgi:signal transduction histidine kinase
MIKHSMRRALIPNLRTLQPVLLGLGAGILVIIAVVGVWLTTSARTQNETLVHTLDVQNRLARILLDLRRLESTQRGYLVTGSADFKLDFNDLLGTVEPQVAELRALTLDNPSQTKALDQVSQIVAQKVAEMQETVRLLDSGDRTAAIALVVTARGQRLMDAIRDSLEGMVAEEKRLFSERSSRSDDTSLALLIVTLTGAGLILLLAGLSIFIVRRSTRERDEAQKTLEEAYAGLEETIAARTADLREANEEIQRFAYIVSHDLRSPLVNIMGFTSELESLRADIFANLKPANAASPADADPAALADEKPTALERDFDEALVFIKASIAKMDRLINAILRLSREGGRAFNPELVEMSTLVSGIIDSMAHQAAERDATVTANELPPVNSDRLALEQVFSNLIDNALKYLRDDEPGRIEITGRVTPSHAIYEVSDNGRGIDQKDHQRVFELFRRAGAQDRPGEGIGLAHVRALVRRLGGAMTLRSELGKGSVFIVTLPRRWIVRSERVAA